MPRASNAPAENQFCKLLLIGDGKLGKTYYAGLPARDGFKVLYLDGDVGRQTILSGQFPAAARENIYLMDVQDRVDGGVIDHNFADFMVQFTTNIKLIWDDTNSKVASRRSDLSKSEVWELFPARLDAGWVLVIDSWTSLVQSVLQWAAREHGVDLSNADSPQMRPVYASAGMKLTQFLVVIRSIRCNVIVIAHPDEYQKMTKPTGQKVKDIKETDMVVEWTKLIPKSSSKPHSLTMSKYFTDIAWMEANRTGSERLLNFRISDERISGGHFNERENIDKYTFANLVKQIGGIVPSEAGSPEPALTIHDAGTYENPTAVTKELGTAKAADDAAQDKPQQLKGIAAMMAAKKSAA